jgi:hypothetical protein
MNPAEVATALLVENTLASSHAYRKVDEGLYAIKQGSAFVMLNIVPWGGDRAILHLAAQLVKGPRMNGQLATELLELNTHLRFGAFAYDPDGELLVFQHSLLGGATLDAAELLAVLRDVALIADEYDDRIIKQYGGQSMRDLLEEAALGRLMERDPSRFKFSEEN